MTSAHVETPVTNEQSFSELQPNPDYHFQSRHIRVIWSLGKYEDLPNRIGELGTVLIKLYNV